MKGKELEVLFLGGVFSKDRKDEIVKKSKGPVQFAADALQWNFINGLEENLDKTIDIINAVFIGSYPKYYTDVIVKEEKGSHKGNSNDVDIGFINIFGLKHILRAVIVKRKLYKWYKEKEGDKNIIIYSMHWPFIYAATKLKKRFNDVKLTIIVPDLPEFMNLSENKSPIVTFLKRIDEYLIKDKLGQIDSFVLLTEQMKEKLNIDNKPYVVIEGMCDPREIVEESITLYNEEDNNKIILYTGTLQKQYGILELLEAFSLIQEKKYRLWICGDGDANKEVIEATKKDSRIKFFGQVPREEALSLQRQCTVLVNPRSAKGEYTKYSFPSKTMEYLLSGKPVVMKRLPGIPSEYEEYITFANEDSAKELSNKIVELCSKTSKELEEIGAKAREFVRKQKNYKKQSEKIIKLINNIEN